MDNVQKNEAKRQNVYIVNTKRSSVYLSGSSTRYPHKILNILCGFAKELRVISEHMS